MKIYKMHASGNDFVLTRFAPGIDYSRLAIKILNRRTGVGGEGLIIVKENPLEIISYNPLGAKELMNANALRCFSKLCSDLKICRKSKLEIITGQGINTVEIEQEIPFLAKVNIGVANFNNQMIYINDMLDAFGRIIRANGVDINTYSFNLAGPNTIVFVDSLSSKYLDYAEAIASHQLFKRHTNVTFVEVINKLNIKYKTYEYINGWVLSSGAGAASALVAAHRLGLTKGKVTAESNDNKLIVEIGKKDNVYVTGPARTVFEADYSEEEY